MPATNGSGHGLAFRSRRGLTVCCLAAVLLVSALYTSTASAVKKPPKPKQFYYLALGDSISYGYSLVKFFENGQRCKEQGPTGPACEPPSAFEPNFVSYFATKLPKHAKTTTVNLSCPGETSRGLIGHSVTLGGGPGAAFNPCGWHNSSGFRRHFEYGTESQLEAAIKLSQEKPAAVTEVTLQIGSNDELAVLGACQSKAYREAHGYANATACAAGEAPALFTKIIKNMGQTIGTLRALGAYNGPIVVLGFYNPYAILQPGTDALQASLNEAVEFTIAKGEFGPRVKYANPFPTFNPAVNEKAALEKFTEFYNIFAIEYSRIKVVEEHEATELPAVIAFQEAFGKPNLAEATAFVEAFGEPPILPNLAETIAAHEAAELAGVIAAQEAAHLAAVIAAQEAAHLAEVTAAEEAAHLEAVIAAQEPGARAAYISACEAEAKTT